MARADKARLVVLAAFALAIAVGCTWALPGADVWAADSISPRSCGLGAIVETYTPGHFHHYPPLHMAILTIVSLPWMAAAAAKAGTNVDALGSELIKPLYMTGIEAGARLVAAAMALGLVWNVMRLFTRIGGSARVGIAAGAIVATNETLVYYAHTGNLEVPYLFWIVLGLVELDRVAAGESRELHALLCVGASVLTKDQAGAAWLLPLPIMLLAVPWRAAGASPVRKSLLVGVGVSTFAFALVSGALVNPSGFVTRMRVEVLGQGKAWEAYPRGVAGTLALTRDALLTTPHFTSWVVAVAACAGVVIALRMRGVERIRALGPLAAALSFTLLFNLGARRTEERFLLPQSVLLFPYAALALDRALDRASAYTASGRARVAVFALAAIALVPPVLGVIAVDGTLLADPRETAGHLLAAMPARTRVDLYGGVLFLPRVAAHLEAVRPGTDPLGDRQTMPNVKDVLDSAPEARAPDVVVLSTEYANDESTTSRPASAFSHYRDAATVAYFRGLRDGSLGYARTKVTCSLPWPLACREIHHSTGGEVWIYEKRPDPR